MGKRFITNDGLQTIHHQGRNEDKVVVTITVSNPESVASLPDIAQRLRAKELYEMREGKQTSVPTLPDIANKLDESSMAENVLSHIHRHRRHHH